jgi:hypothetical protein
MSSDHSSLKKLILLVDGCQCGYITKSKEKIKPLGINLKYNKYLFSLKIHLPKKLLIFSSLKTKKITNEYLLFENLRPKDCEIWPRKKKKNQLPPTTINPKVTEVFEDWILKGWRNAEFRNR